MEERLQSFGATLKDVQRQFTERTIAGEWLRQRTPKPKEATHDEMLAYDQPHVEEYDYPAKARWEELMIRFDRHNGDPQAAWREMAEIANLAWQQAAATPNVRGAVFEEVAKERSHGFTADRGG